MMEGEREPLCLHEKLDSLQLAGACPSRRQHVCGGFSLSCWIVTGYVNKQALFLSSVTLPMPLASLDFLACLCIFSCRTLCPQTQRGPEFSHTFLNV